MKWETVIGLEVHAELSTRSKIFCGCSTAFGGEPNIYVCPVCAGMPGSLPKLNRTVVEYAVRTGLALGCTITRHTRFDRKNYFYPDLPKAYQVSQLYAPVCRGGGMEIEAGGAAKPIRLREIHMEEDAGKLVHDAGNITQMDFNRCGVPLLEIVTQPDFQNAAEALAFLEKLRETLLYLGVSDGKMQEGSLRADVNLSLRRPGGELGVRTEMKNLNSFKAVSRAIHWETARQTDILESGGRIEQETRRWDDDRGESYGMRSKENAPDYRYFPEPDLLPVVIDDAWLARIQAGIPELAHEKRARYQAEYGLTEKEAGILTRHLNMARLFETLAQKTGEPLEAAHMLTGDIMRLMNAASVPPEEIKTDAGKLAALISLLTDKKINRTAYKETLEAVFLRGADPETYIRENNLMIIGDADTVAGAVSAVIAENPDAAADYQNGKEKAFGFLVGKTMKRLGGAANPGTVREMLEKLLKG